MFLFFFVPVLYTAPWLAFASLLDRFWNTLGFTLVSCCHPFSNFGCSVQQSCCPATAGYAKGRKRTPFGILRLPFGSHLASIWLPFGSRSHPVVYLWAPYGSYFLPLAYPVGSHQRRHTRGSGPAGLLRRNHVYIYIYMYYIYTYICYTNEHSSHIVCRGRQIKFKNTLASSFSFISDNRY